MNSTRSLLLLLLFALPATACVQSVQRTESGANFLRMSGYVQVMAAEDRLEGFFRWHYFSEDPVQHPSPAVFCETWEYLELDRVESFGDCPGCSDFFAGSSVVQPSPETTCDEPGWEERDVQLAIGLLEDLDSDQEEVDRLSSEGYTHRVLTPWSPEVGTTSDFQELFVAFPEQWSPEDGEAGAAPGEPLEGQYRMEGRYYWVLQDPDDS
ncbi:MAG: hypothetical protein VX498_09685 [Myxococcota bacterium]|nr:hypothetical protein [Myxococcota bacterium]